MTRCTVTQRARDVMAQGALESGVGDDHDEDAPLWHAFDVDVMTFAGTRTRVVVAIDSEDARALFGADIVLGVRDHE